MKNSDFRYQKVLPYMNPNLKNVKNIKRPIQPLPNLLAKGSILENILNFHVTLDHRGYKNLLLSSGV